MFRCLQESNAYSIYPGEKKFWRLVYFVLMQFPDEVRKLEIFASGLLALISSSFFIYAHR